MGGLIAATILGAMSYSSGPVQQSDGTSASVERAKSSTKSEVQKNTPQRLAQLDQNLAIRSGWRRVNRGPRREPGTGWPVATDRRRAKKAKNVLRNRKAQR